MIKNSNIPKYLSKMHINESETDGTVFLNIDGQCVGNAVEHGKLYEIVIDRVFPTDESDALLFDTAINKDKAVDKLILAGLEYLTGIQDDREILGNLHPKNYPERQKDYKDQDVKVRVRFDGKEIKFDKETEIGSMILGVIEGEKALKLAILEMMGQEMSDIGDEELAQMGIGEDDIKEYDLSDEPVPIIELTQGDTVISLTGWQNIQIQQFIGSCVKIMENTVDSIRGITRMN